MLIALMVIVVSISMLLALVALLRNPGSVLHRWLFTLIFFACAWLVAVNLHGVFNGQLSLWSAKFTFVFALFLSYSVFNFVEKVCGVRRSLTINAGIWLVTAILAAVSLTPLVVESISGPFMLERGKLYPVVIGLILAFLTFSVYHLEKYRLRAHGQRATQIFFVEVGLAGAALIGVLTNIILPNILNTSYPGRFGSLAILFLTFTLIYAVVQHRFLDIRLAIARAVAYALVVAAMVGAYILTAYLLAQLLLRQDDMLPIDIQVVYISSALLVATIFGWLRHFFDRLTNRLFFRFTYDPKEVINKVTDALVEEIEPLKLVKRVSNALTDAVKSSRVEVVIVKDNTHFRYIINGEHKQTSDRLMEMFLHAKERILSVEDLDDKYFLHARMRREGVAVVAQLGTPKEVVGYLILGYKSSGEAYRNRDLDLISIVADELAIGIQNALRFESISQFNSTLQKEINDATGQLRDSNKKLQSLDKSKDDFISMASHQLRTPLTSVKGYLSMLLDGDLGHIKPEQRRVLQEAYASSQHMAHLIGDFLNVSRMQTGKVMLDTRLTDLANLVAEEVEQAKLIAERQNVKIVFARPKQFPLVQIDESKIRQVVMNFLDNAIFYSKAKGEIEVRLIKRENEICLEVEDHGIGVPADEQHKLFTKFFRGTNARSKRPDGTGIGLFMAKKVIVAHRGSVVFKSRLNKGSVFGFCLPEEPKIEA